MNLLDLSFNNRSTRSVRFLTPVECSHIRNPAWDQIRAKLAFESTFPDEHWTNWTLISIIQPAQGSTNWDKNFSHIATFVKK